MSPAKKFTFVNKQGEETALPTHLIPLATSIAPLAIAAIKGETVAETSYRGIAEVIGKARMGYKFAGDKAGSTRGLPACDFDYRGLSPEASADENMVWSAVIPTAHLAKWKAAQPGKGDADYPLRKKVGYHLEIVVKELFVKNNPNVEGELESNGNMTGALAELFTAQTGLAAADRTSRRQNKTASTTVVSPKTKPVETLETISGAFGLLEAASFSEVHGSDRRKVINQIKAMRLHAENLLAEMTSATKPVDKRRVRAAEAA